MNELTRFLLNAVLIAGCAMLIAGCDKEQYFDGPNGYTDGFELYDTVTDLLDGDENWRFFQLTYEENEVTVDSAIVRTGNRSIKTMAIPSPGKSVSKASINKNKMAFWEGDIVSISAWYYISGNDEADWLFIMDLEERTAIGAGPGMRLVLVKDALILEHKYLNPNIYQPEGEEVLFPRNQWVNVRFETLLSQKKEGYVKVWQDDVLLIHQENWNTLPEDILYFQQGTKGMYTSVELGNTANGADYTMTVYLDDIQIEVLNE